MHDATASKPFELAFRNQASTKGYRIGMTATVRRALQDPSPISEVVPLERIR